MLVPNEHRELLKPVSCWLYVQFSLWVPIDSLHLYTGCPSWFYVGAVNSC